MWHRSMSRRARISPIVAALALLVLVYVPSVQAGRSAALNKLIEEAKKEKTIRGMWSSRSLGGSRGLAEIVRGMNKRYGLNIKSEFTPGLNMQRMMARISREVKAGQPASSDVYWGNAEAMLQAMNAQVEVLKPMDWQAILERPLGSEPGFDPIAPGGLGLASASTLVGVMYNSDMVNGNDIPRRLKDVLKPKWKGKIASTPYAAGIRAFAMPELLGRKAMIEFTKALSKQIHGLIRCRSSGRITSGEFLMLVLSCGNHYANQAQRYDIPLGYSVLDDATVSDTRYAGVPRNSRAPKTAALLITYLHTKEGQKLLWEQSGFDFHLYPESRQKKTLDKARAAGARVVIKTPQWLDSMKGYRHTQRELEKILREGR